MKSPSSQLFAYLQAFDKRNYKKMLRLSTYTFQTNHNPSHFSKLPVLNTYQLVNIKTDGCVSDAVVKLNDLPFSVRLIQEVGAFKAGESGKWGVVPSSFRSIKEENEAT